MAVDKEANSLSIVYSYYSKFNLRLFYAYPALARYLSVLFLNILTLLACTQVDKKAISLLRVNSYNSKYTCPYSMCNPP